MAFPTDGFTVNSVRLQASAGDASFALPIVLDGEIVTEAFIADVVKALETALAVARPGDPVSSFVIYQGAKNI